MKLLTVRKCLFLMFLFGLTALSTAGCVQGVNIEATFPDRDTKTSAFGWVGVSFSIPVIEESVEDAFSITPEITGDFLWLGNSFWFRPIQAFEKDIEYQAQLSGVLEFENGKTIRVAKSWKINIRVPDIIYFVKGEEGGELWRSSIDGVQTHQLSFTDNFLYEYSASRSGDTIAYTVKNEGGGYDLWVMNRDGGNQRRLVRCEADLCGEPAWSMDEQRIAYTRQIYNPSTGNHQEAQVWTVAIKGGQTTKLYQSDIAFGHSPSYSPDGIRFASYDLVNQGIRILDLTTSQESIVPRIVQGSGEWSPDGTKLVFTDLVAAENEPFVNVFMLDLETRAVNKIFETGGKDTDFSQPRWSPGGDVLAVGLRPVNSPISRALWILRLDGTFSRKIAEDPSATFTAYQWDPWGESLVFQRYDLNSAASSIWLWTDGESKMIVQNGARPQWLP